VEHFDVQAYCAIFNTIPCLLICQMLFKSVKLHIFVSWFTALLKDEFWGTHDNFQYLLNIGCINKIGRSGREVVVALVVS